MPHLRLHTRPGGAVPIRRPVHHSGLPGLRCYGISGIQRVSTFINQNPAPPGGESGFACAIADLSASLRVPELIAHHPIVTYRFSVCDGKGLYKLKLYNEEKILTLTVLPHIDLEVFPWTRTKPFSSRMSALI